MREPLAATRRGLLALAGAATFAGCSAFRNSDADRDSEPTVDAERVQRVVGGDRPSIPERLPVDIAPAFLDRGLDRAQGFLDSVPSPLGPEEIPNGAIRRELSRKFDTAGERLQRARDGRTPFERLSRLEGARSDARYVAAAWRAIDGDLTRADIRDEAAGVAAEVEAARREHALVGVDPVRATRVHAAVESSLDSAAAWAAIPERSRRYAADNPLAVGEAAEDLERAVGSRESAVHVFERFEASLDGPRDVGPTLRAARSSLLDDLRDEADALAEIDPEEPWGDADLDGTVLGEAIDDLYQEVRPERQSWEESSPTPARDLLELHETLASIRGLERLRDRAAGDPARIASADDVRTVRADAIGAVRAAREETPEPMLTGHLLPSLADRVERADRRLQNQSGSVDIGRLGYDLAAYFRVAAVARELPGVGDRVATAIREG